MTIKPRIRFNIQRTFYDEKIALLVSICEWIGDYDYESGNLFLYKNCFDSIRNHAGKLKSYEIYFILFRKNSSNFINSKIFNLKLKKEQIYLYLNSNKLNLHHQSQEKYLEDEKGINWGYYSILPYDFQILENLYRAVEYLQVYCILIPENESQMLLDKSDEIVRCLLQPTDNESPWESQWGPDGFKKKILTMGGIIISDQYCRTDFPEQGLLGFGKTESINELSV